MKNLKKALAVVVALSVITISGSALAATGNCTLSGGDASISANFADNALTATVNSGAEIGSQMTFVILNEGKGSGTIVADDIIYIDQKELKADDKSFTGAINLDRVTGKPAVLPEGASYPVKLGYYDLDGDFQIASGYLTIAVTTKVDTITTAAAEAAICGTGLDLTDKATVTGTGSYDDTYTWSIDQSTNGIGATLTGNLLDATSAGTVTVVATANGDSTKTARKVVTFSAPAPKLTVLRINGATSATTGSSVSLSAEWEAPDTAGVTVAWSTSDGTIDATGTNVTLSGVTSAKTVTVTAVATSAAGDSVPASIDIVFSAPAPVYVTVSFMLGDVDGADGVNLTDADYIASKVLGGNANVGGAYAIGTSITDIAKKTFVFGDVDGADGVNLTDADYVSSKVLGGSPSVGATDGDGNAVAIGGTMTFKVNAE